MNAYTNAPRVSSQVGPKHRARKPKWPRITALVAGASMLAAAAIGALALQPASAVQDQFTPADVNLMPPAPNCTNFGCTWDLLPAPDAYSFALMRDSVEPGGLLEIAAQSDAGLDGAPVALTARVVDTGRILIVDFFEGRARIWSGGNLIMQASPSMADLQTADPSATTGMRVLPVALDPNFGAKVQIRQVFVPSATIHRLDVPSDAEVSAHGDDLSAIARVTFSESVTGVEASDFALSDMSAGCRVGEVVDSGDGKNFEVRIRGCTSDWMSLRLLAGSVVGSAAGPSSDVYFGPIQPRVVAVAGVVEAGVVATPAPSVTPAPEVPVSETTVVTPVVSAPVVAVPVAEVPLVPAPVEVEPVVQPVVATQVVAVAPVATPVAVKPAPVQPVAAPRVSATAAPAAIDSGSSGGGGVTGTGGPAAWPQQWLGAASSGLAVVLAAVGATIAARKLRGRARVRVRLS